MGLKGKLGMGVMSAALGLALVGGGTYAYFSDSEDTNNTFAAGTLDLSANPTAIVDVDNLKPSDRIERDFTLKNDGSLDIAKANLKTSYDVEDAKGDNEDDFGKQIQVVLFEKLNDGALPTPIVQNKTLNEIEGKHLSGVLGKEGLAPGETAKYKIILNFLDSNSADQNQFQGDSLKLKWTFDAKQGNGSSK